MKLLFVQGIDNPHRGVVILPDHADEEEARITLLMGGTQVLSWVTILGLESPEGWPTYSAFEFVMGGTDRIGDDNSGSASGTGR